MTPRRPVTPAVAALSRATHAAQANRLPTQFLFIWHHALHGPALTREHRFAADVGRGYRFDFAHPATRVYIELEGGFYKPRASHTSLKGRLRDVEKYNLAAALGWRGIRLPTGGITVANCTLALDTINALLAHAAPAGLWEQLEALVNVHRARPVARRRVGAGK